MTQRQPTARVTKEVVVYLSLGLRFSTRQARLHCVGFTVGGVLGYLYF